MRGGWWSRGGTWGGIKDQACEGEQDLDHGIDCAVSSGESGLWRSDRDHGGAEDNQCEANERATDDHQDGASGADDQSGAGDKGLSLQSRRPPQVSSPLWNRDIDRP